MSSIGGNVGLLVASLDLKLVQLIRGAMAVADAQGSAGGANSPTQPSQPARRQVPPVERPAAVVGSPPRLRGGIDVTDIRRPLPTYNRHGLVGTCRTEHHFGKVAASGAVPVVPPTIQPPWRTLPWPVAPRPILSIHRTIKIAPGRTDVKDVGQTLDIFV